MKPFRAHTIFSLPAVLLILLLVESFSKAEDLTVVGFINAADGLGQIPIGVIDTLRNDLSINFVASRPSKTQEVSKSVLDIFNKPFKKGGNVALFFDLPWDSWDSQGKRYMSVPQDCIIKLAYSMFEATEIHPEWVKVFNNHFDAVVVPDPFHVNVYKNSGVKKPIFVLPFGAYLEDFLKQPLKQKSQDPFIFGCSAGFWVKKNYDLLLEAFMREFKNDPRVLLKLHGRAGENLNNIKKKIAQLGLANVQLITYPLNRRDYIRLFNSFDCYVLLSKAEGFSITPREAMACGIPCILSNNTAHITLCNSGLVRSIKATTKEPAYCHHYKRYIGHFFNSDLCDTRKALREVYSNYNNYLKKSHDSKKWVERYLWKNLKVYYLNLIKPLTVTFGDVNVVTPQGIITNSIDLYTKYKKILSH